jgi:integrase
VVTIHITSSQSHHRGDNLLNTTKAVQSFLSSRQAKGLSPHTIRWYSGILRTLAREHPRLPVRPEIIEGFIAGRQAGDERKHGYYRSLRCFYRFLARRYNLPNPIEMVEAPKRSRKFPHWLMPDELMKLLAYPHVPSVKAALLFLADTGARVGELSSLELESLRETPWGYIAIVQGKTGLRPVPISPRTYEALAQVLPFRYSPYRLRIKVSQAFRAAGVKGSAHSLRHTFATLWEGDEGYLQRILGHSSIATTQLYRHLRLERLIVEHRLYSPLSVVLPVESRH